MPNNREALLKELKSRHSKIAKHKDVQTVLNKTLSNSNEPIDHSAWLEGSKDFAQKNEKVLRAVLG